MKLIENLKHHGAILSIEAELSTRICALTEAHKTRNFALVYSTCKVIEELAEELRKLEPNQPNATQPIPVTS